MRRWSRAFRPDIGCRRCRRLCLLGPGRHAVAGAKECLQPGSPEDAAGGKKRRSYVAQTGILKKPAVSGAMSRACSDGTSSDVSGWPELNASWYSLAAS